MKELLRPIIREYVEKMFENFPEDDYLSSFELEDIPDMQPGGEAHQAFLKDLENEPLAGKYKPTSELELKNLIKGMQQANLELPSDDELISKAEQMLHRKLNQPEVEIALKTKHNMQKTFGAGSYN